MGNNANKILSALNGLFALTALLCFFCNANKKIRYLYNNNKLINYKIKKKFAKIEQLKVGSGCGQSLFNVVGQLLKAF